ncbi:CapA family protein [Paenibacillus thalictri]|uniref:CapA family protein n=2 Tax=Paenibacillus thalictri TaxID=2527873 RepID=A0A4Q9DYC6_9BACL|nr:CapA family protein [Paenibacillus thalictri]
MYWLSHKGDVPQADPPPATASQTGPSAVKTAEQIAGAGSDSHANPVTNTGDNGANAAAKPPEPVKQGDPPQAQGGTNGSVNAEPVSQAKPPEDGVVKLAFTGDVMWASKVEDLLKQNGYDYPYQEVKSYLESPDVTVANLETPVTTRGKAQTKDYIYRSSPQAMPAFAEAGFDVVNLANNHILDYGKDGLLDTIDQLKAANIQYVGAGKDIKEAYRPVIMEKNGLKIAFLGFSRVAEDKSWYATNTTPGVAQTYTTDLALEAIRNAKETADLVIVLAHWGVERQDKPAKEQTNLAHLYIDNGADLVVASHPHVLQSFEQYNGKWIAYSLGNFIFTTNNTSSTWETVIMNATCNKTKSCGIQLIPIFSKWAQPVKMTEEDGAKLFNRLSGISINAKIDTEGKLIPVEKQNQPR